MMWAFHVAFLLVALLASTTATSFGADGPVASLCEKSPAEASPVYLTATNSRSRP